MNFSILTVDIRAERDAIRARQRARQIAELLGFDAQDQTRIATAISEIARNAVQHGGGAGTLEFRLSDGVPQMLEMIVRDEGPGIPDLDRLLHTASAGRGETIRGVSRLMDECNIESSPHGATVTLGKRRPRILPAIDRRAMGQITSTLLQRLSEDPIAEVQRQNRELLHMLNELRLQQETQQAHQREIETLNLRLRRSVRATHHRMKNNLQIISALIELQTDAGEQVVPVDAMIRIGQHTRALAALHDMLTRQTQTGADIESISVKAALAELIPLFQATAGGRQIVHRADDFYLTVNESNSLALLIAELISNAVKHGRNVITVALTANGSTATLEVCNEGPGFPADFDWRQSANTGIAIIDSTAHTDLKGTLSFGNRVEGGACVTVTFPINRQFDDGAREIRTACGSPPPDGIPHSS